MEDNSDHEIPESVNDPLTQHFLDVGAKFSGLMGWGSIQKCNCMIRYGAEESQTPAVRKGKHFFTPEGYEIAPPTSYEDMPSTTIIKMMKDRGEVYIGHIFGPSTPE